MFHHQILFLGWISVSLIVFLWTFSIYKETECHHHQIFLDLSCFFWSLMRPCPKMKLSVTGSRRAETCSSFHLASIQDKADRYQSSWSLTSKALAPVIHWHLTSLSFVQQFYTLASVGKWYPRCTCLPATNVSPHLLDHSSNSQRFSFHFVPCFRCFDPRYFCCLTVRKNLDCSHHLSLGSTCSKEFYWSIGFWFPLVLLISRNLEICCSLIRLLSFDGWGLHQVGF